MTEKVVLVTGGNSGIGFECARALARAGESVVIASRNRASSVRAVERISRETGNERVSELGLDLGSLAGVRQFAKEVEARELAIGALVCNAGLQLNDGPRLTPDGFETTFAVNHLGHFLLANLLLRRLVQHAPARVLVVASGVHDPALFTGMPKADVTDFDTLAASGGPTRDGFEGRLAYVNSKLCNLWFTYELARRIEASGVARPERPVSVNGFEPGLVPGSGLAREYPPALRFVWDNLLPPLARVVSLVVPGINTAGKAGGALAGLVRDPALERVSGLYHPSHTRWRPGASSHASYDEQRARELWEASARMTGLTPEESPLVT